MQNKESFYRVLPVPALPHTQALVTKTFKPPPLDGTMSIPEMYDWHLENSADHPLFVYSDAEGNTRTIFWPEGVRAVHRAGHHVKSLITVDAGQAQKSPIVVAILAAADTITYFTFIVGIMRAGFVVFPISPRNSAAAVAHLLGKTNVTHVLVGSETALQSLASAALDILQGSKPETSTIPTFDDVFIVNGEKPFTPLETRRPDQDEIAVILHSSGSTAFPKPITWTYYGLFQLSTVPYFGERDLTGVRLACHSMPMFHGMGLMQTGWTATAGLVLTSFEPQCPAIIPTPDAVMRGSIDTKSDVIFCVPSFIEAWSRVPEYVDHLRKIDGVLYGGGPMNKRAGDALYDNGVSIFNLYGCTECGIFSMILPKKIDKDWEYFFIASCVRSKFVPDGRGNAEFIVLPYAHMLPRVLNTEIDGVDAYATGDLLSPHPTKPGFWKIFGRADDQIMHNTGEKTNPGPLENFINQDPHVQSSVMFGRGKFYAGIIVDPKPDLRFDPSNVEALVDFRHKIWPSVEKLNNYAPQHSRLFKEMIMVSKPLKPFTYTAKSTARRQAIINDYEDEIDELYVNVEETTQPWIVPPTVWGLSHCIDFVKATVSNVLKQSVSNEEDIFQIGCDSLQATWIRNTLLNALRQTSTVDTRAIPINFVYAYPTIASLAEYLSGLTNSKDASVSLPTDATKAKADEMEAMLVKYTDDLEKNVPRSTKHRDSGGNIVVVLTGSTGGLGAALLAELLASSDIFRVFALNRPSAGKLIDRQKTAFRDRGLDESILSLPKLVLVEADISKEMCGLNRSTYDDILNSATHIIHNAYTVNFNLSLATFEKNVQGLRNLITLALSSPYSSPPQFFFTSSVSVLRIHEGKGPVKEELVPAMTAVGSGYSESKWVCEQMLAKAAQTTGLSASILRLGQLSGMSTNGFWNPQDWVPALFRSSVFIRCFPEIDNDISWIPIDIAAQAIIEMLTAPNNQMLRVLHIAHPSPVHWSMIMRPTSQMLDLKVVPYADWLADLNHSGHVRSDDQIGSADDAVSLASKNPALRISEFFNGGMYGVNATSDHSVNGAGSTRTDSEAMGIKRLSLTNALHASKTLRERCAPLTADDVKKWISHWELGIS